MLVSMIAAVAENGVIGRDGGMPWHLPADLKFFRRTTMGKPIIMGRKTFDSIGKPLDGRLNIVVSRHPTESLKECVVVSSIERAIEVALQTGVEEAVVIGGGTIYAQALPLAQRVYLTRIHASVDGDTFFPTLEPSAWVEVKRENHAADEKNSHPYSFCVLDRVERHTEPHCD